MDRALEQFDNLVLTQLAALPRGIHQLHGRRPAGRLPQSDASAAVEPGDVVRGAAPRHGAPSGYPHRRVPAHRRRSSGRGGTRCVASLKVAAPSQVLLTQSARDLIGDHALLEARGAHDLEGRDGRVVPVLRDDARGVVEINGCHAPCLSQATPTRCPSPLTVMRRAAPFLCEGCRSSEADTRQWPPQRTPVDGSIGSAAPQGNTSCRESLSVDCRNSAEGLRAGF